MVFNSTVLKELTSIYGPSGHEGRVSNYIQNYIKDDVDEIFTDKMGNLFAHKKGPGPKVMMAGHMDTIALMVIDIEKEGFLRFTNIGGINPYITHGERVIFEDGTIGIVYAEKKADMKELKLDKLFIDIGAKDKEEAEKITHIGDICAYLPQHHENENTVTTGGLDDRIGCFVMMESIKNLKSPKNDCYFVFTVQEEVGIRGARMAAFKLDPDVGIAVDVTDSGDTPGSNRFVIGLGKGAAIKVKDNSLLSHPKVNEHLVNACKGHSIDYQMEVLEFGGQDAGWISLTREGIPSTCISIPTRYLHSAHETISKHDVTSAIDLLTHVLSTPILI